MEESAENETAQKSLSYVKDRIDLFTTAVIMASSVYLRDFLKGSLELYCFFLFLFLVHYFIQQILNKENNQPFDYGKFFKKSILYSVVLLICFFLFEMASAVFAVFSNL